MNNMEVCQPGNDGLIPAWCVDFEFGLSEGIQLFAECLILLLIFGASYLYFEWKKRRAIQKEMRKRLEDEQRAKVSNTTSLQSPNDGRKY